MVKDHLGNEFKTKILMCKHYGLKEGTFNERVKRGYTLERALTDSLGKSRGKSKECCDHTGKKFKCIDDMLIYYERSKTAYYSALKKGRTQEEALLGYVNIPAQNKGSIEKRTDHLGNVYKSINEMCSAYSVSLDTYKGRIKRGWSVERALTEGSKVKSKVVQDYLGNKFSNSKDMCRFYNVTYEAYKGRLNRGYNEKAAISKILDSVVNGLKIVKEVYQDEEGIFYYLCDENGKEDILSGYEVLMYGK